MFRFFPFLCILTFSFSMALAQTDTFSLELSSAIHLAKKNALDIQLGQSQIREYISRQADFIQDLRPQLNLSAILPNLSRSIEARPLPDGRDAFVNRSTMYNNLGLRLSQQLVNLNASWYVSSELERLDVFKTSLFPKSQTYFFSPVSLGFDVSFFGFNKIKWDRERLKLEFDELNAEQVDIIEEVIGEAILFYSNCFLSQQKMDLVYKQIEDTDSLIQIKARLNKLGKVSKVELLQLDLRRQNMKNQYNEAQVEFKNAERVLLNFLMINTGKDHIAYTFPENWKAVSIDKKLAKIKVSQNGYLQISQSLSIRILEAELDKIQKDNGPKLSLNASVGLNKTDESLDNVYRDLLDRQVISARLDIPLANRKARKIKAQGINERLYRQTIENKQELIDQERMLEELISRYDLLNQKIQIDKEALDISNEIYDLTRTQFLAGNASYNDLNIVDGNRIQASSNYSKTVFDSIITYYAIRKLCHYDFEKGRDLLGGN